MRRLQLLAILSAVVFFSDACSRSQPVPDDRGGQSARQAYLGEWRNVSGGDTITIEENSTNLLLRLENDQKLVGTIDSDGNLRPELASCPSSKRLDTWPGSTANTNG
jgi:hypothetical protein